MNNLFKSVSFILMIFNASFSSAQLKVHYTDDTENLVQNVMLGKNTNIELLASRYLGSAAAIGTFSSHMVYNTFIDSGIILSTGNVLDAVGPNESNNKSGKNVESGMQLLSKLAKAQKTYDAAALAFDFTSKLDSIAFEYIFASEEYPEFVNRNVNDVFAFVLVNLENGSKQNLATLPNSQTPICVDAINHISNSQYFNLNGRWEANNVAKWRTDSTRGETALMLEFDGFTTVLTAGAKIKPNTKYRLVMAIADVGDDVYDTAIFLKANSLRGASSNEPNKLFSNITINQDGSFLANKNIDFAFGAHTITNQNSLLFIDSLAKYIKNRKPKRIDIIGHTDNIGSENDNQILSEKRANEVKRLLLMQGVSAKVVYADGKGESEPLSLENAAKNRRVAFRFYF